MVSVVMPAYNQEKYIEQGIKSVLAQTYTDWELIVINDGSTDKTAEVVRQIMIQQGESDGHGALVTSSVQLAAGAALTETTAGQIRLLELDKNGGVAHARNVGVAQARGEWIAFLDADDLWLPEKLERELAYANETGAEFVYGPYYVLGSDEIADAAGDAGTAGADAAGVDPVGADAAGVDPVGADAAEVDTVGVSLMELVKGAKCITPYWDKVSYRKLLKTNCIPCLTVLIKGDIMKEYPMPVLHHEDYAAWLTILRERVDTAYCYPEVCAIYRVHGDSLSANKWKTLGWNWHIYFRHLRLGLWRSVYYMGCFILLTGLKYLRR